MRTTSEGVFYRTDGCSDPCDRLFPLLRLSGGDRDLPAREKYNMFFEMGDLNTVEPEEQDPKRAGNLPWKI